MLKIITLILAAENALIWGNGNAMPETGMFRFVFIYWIKLLLDLYTTQRRRIDKAHLNYII